MPSSPLTTTYSPTRQTSMLERSVSPSAMHHMSGTAHGARVDANNTNEIIAHLFAVIKDLGGRVGAIERDTLLRDADSRLDASEHVARVDQLMRDHQKIQTQLMMAQDQNAAMIAKKVDDTMHAGLSELTARMEAHLVDKMEHFCAQHRNLVTEAKADVQILEHQVKEQLSYSMELTSRETRRDITELHTRVESAHRFIEEGVELKRKLTDIDSTMETMQRRVENLSTEMLQRLASQGGLRGRLDLVETTIQEHRGSLIESMDQLRDEIDSKCADSEVQRLFTRLDQQAADFKALKASNTKMEATVADLKNLYQHVDTLNDRITSTLGENESAAVSLSGEVGEVKGKLESLAARQTQLELKAVETTRGTQAQLDDMLHHVNNRTETLTNNKTLVLEAKIAQQLDGVLAQGKNWRTQNTTLLRMLEEKMEEHDHSMAKVQSELEGGIRSRLTQVNNELRELGRRVDVAVQDRKDGVQDMRRELSTVQEIASGLQHQYEQLLTEAAQRTAQWTDHNHNVRTRVENLENTAEQQRALLDTAMDDVRHNARSVLDQQAVDLVTSVQQLVGDRERVKQIQLRLEEDCRATAKAVSDLDERIHGEVAELREHTAQVAREMVQAKNRTEATEQRSQADNARTVKAVVELDAALNTASRELKEVHAKTDAELTQVKRSVEFVTNNKLPALETRIADAAKYASSGITSDVADLKEKVERLGTESARASDVDSIHVEVKNIKDKLPSLESQLGNLVKTANTGLLNEISSLKTVVDAAATQHSVEQLQFEIKTINAAQKEGRVSTDKLETQAKALGNTIEDIKIKLTDTQAEAMADVQHKLENCNEELKGMRNTNQTINAQVTNLTRVTKELGDTQDKTANHFSELQSNHVALSSQLTNAITKLETLKKVELSIQTLNKNVKDLGDTQSTLQQNTQLLKNANTENANQIAAAITKLDPAVKKAEQQINSLLKSTTQLTNSEERNTSAISEMQAQLTDISVNLGSASSKIDSVIAKPLATEQALKALAQHVENVNTSCANELESIEANLSEAMNKMAGDTATKIKALINAITELKQRADSNDITSKEHLTQIVNAMDENKQGASDKASDLGKRITDLFNDFTLLKSHTSKLQVAFGDTKSLSKTLNDLNDRLNQSLNELRHSTGGVSQDIITVKQKIDKINAAQQQTDSKFGAAIESLSKAQSDVGRADVVHLQNALERVQKTIVELGERAGGVDNRLTDQEKLLKRTLQQDITNLAEQLNVKFQQCDDKMIDLVEGLQGSQEKIASTIRNTQHHLEEHINRTSDVTEDLESSFADLAGRLDLLLEKMKTVGQFNEFGVNAVKDLIEKMGEFEQQIKSDVDNRANEINFAVEDQICRYDEKLGLLQEKAGTLNSINTGAVQLMQDFEARLNDAERRTVEPLQALLSLFDLDGTAVTAIASANQREKVVALWNTPAFAQLLTRLESLERTGGTTFAGSSTYSAYSTESTSSRDSSKVSVGMNISENLVISNVSAGGPAEQAGLRRDDMVLEVDGQPIRTRDDYKVAIKRYKVHDAVTHTYERDGERLTAQVILGPGVKRR